MRRLPHNRLIRVGILLVLLLGVALVMLRFGRSSGRPTGRVTLQYLGPATNFVDPGWKWAAFSISNGTSKPLFYNAAGVDYQSGTGWISAPWTPGRGPVGINHLSNSLVVAPSNSVIFLAGIPTSSIPWRLRLSYREAGVVGSLFTSFHKINDPLRGSPPTIVWSGTPHLLIGNEIAPYTMRPNPRSALDARTALCLHVECHWPGASESER
jgi:hypothetical protein